MKSTEIGVVSLGKAIEVAFNQENIDVVKIKEIILLIHSLPTKVKREYESLYNSIEQKLFDKHIKLSEYQPEHFKNSIAKVRVEVKTGKSPDDNFENKFKELINCCHNDLKLLNKCLILRFGSFKGAKISYLLLHDTKIKPVVFSSIKTAFNDDCEIYSLDSFTEDLDKSTIKTDYNYIVLLVLNSNPNPEYSLLPQIQKIQGFLAPIEQVHLIKEHTTEGFYIIESNFQKIESEIKYIVSKELRDIDLKNEVEKILKKLFEYNPCISLEYQKISKGFSGSSVYYIRPSGLTHSQVRFIVKVGETVESKAKIETEIVNFKKCVDSFDITYNIVIERTEQCIAIRYNYASKDSKIDSLPFAELFAPTETEKLLTILNTLFEIPLFKQWNSYKRIHDIKFDEQYKIYVNIERIKKSIGVIKGISIDDVENTKLLKIFRVLAECSIESYQKVCHGDLHSENFFIDSESNVFLIDFGDTDTRHALIDYTALECSIKFKHIPSYIENQELYKIEEDLLNIDSFDPGFQFINITRFDLMKPFSLIAQIRSLAKSQMMIKDQNSSIEYFYSLFMITLRQIQYDTMNQLYAIYSAELLGAKILSLLGKDVDETKRDLF